MFSSTNGVLNMFQAAEKNAIQFEMNLIPTENLPSIYGYNELNGKLFNSLFIDHGPHQFDFLEENLPIHLVKFQAYFGIIQKLVHNEERILMRVESTPRSGFPFLLIKSNNEKIRLINPMNYSDEVLTVQEASLALSVFTYNYFYEMAKTETEQDFCIFMMEYLKRLADFNYKEGLDREQQPHNVLGIFSLID